MAQEPQVRDLIQQQGVTMAGTALGEVRSRTATADRWVERVVRRALRMQQLEEPGAPTNSTSVAPAPLPAQPQPVTAQPLAPAPQTTAAAGRVQWAMDGPTEVC